MRVQNERVVLILVCLVGVVLGGCSEPQRPQTADHRKQEEAKTAVTTAKSTPPQTPTNIQQNEDDEVSRDLSAPVTLNSKLGDSQKIPVLIYYANETAPGEAEKKNWDQAIEWLRGSDDKDVKAIADQLENDLRKFPAAVDDEIDAIARSASRSGYVRVVVFTNRLARQGHFHVLKSAADDFRAAAIKLPEFEKSIYASHPLSHPAVFHAALVAVGQQFDPATHEFVLVTKSHGKRDMALTPRLAVNASEIGREELLALARTDATVGRMLDKDDFIDKENYLDKEMALDKDDGLQKNDLGDLNRPGASLGVSKMVYVATLRKVGAETGMQFPVLFIESCKSQLDGVMLDSLRTREANIGRLYTSDLKGLEYKTLDYAALFERAAETDTFAEAVHQILFEKYEEQKAKREKESVGFREDSSLLDTNEGLERKEGLDGKLPKASAGRFTPTKSQPKRNVN